jgi:GntR family transcriptional regulator/MocR family aminotransferase
LTFSFDFLDFGDDKPGYIELSQAIIDAVASGRLTVGTQLPPSRSLADELNISRDTALRCYKHLKSLGWIKSDGNKGTFIAHGTEVATRDPSKSELDFERLSSYAKATLARADDAPGGTDLAVFTAAPAEFLPVKRWRLAMQKTAESLSSRDIQYREAVLGQPELRSAIATYMSRGRGIPCTTDEVAIFNVSFQAMEVIFRLFLKPGDVIAVEEPGYGGVKEAAKYLNIEFLPVPLDAEGISMEPIENAGERVKLVYVNTTHEEPTGVTMSLQRRKQLLEWAKKNSALIIEDDFDGHMQYGARIPQRLKALDTEDRVIYLASFWQFLYPLTTLCFVVVPPAFMSVLQDAKRHTMSISDSAGQLTLADVLTDGFFQKHIQKMERDFSARRQAMIAALRQMFGTDVFLPTQTCGLTIMVRFLKHTDDQVVEAAQKAGLPLATTEPLYVDRSLRKSGEFQVYFVGLDEESTAHAVSNFHAHLGT